MWLVRQKPVPAGEISGNLGLDPAEVARHLQDLAHQGLVSFGEGETLVAAA